MTRRSTRVGQRVISETHAHSHSHAWSLLNGVPVDVLALKVTLEHTKRCLFPSLSMHVFDFLLLWSD